MVGRRRLDGRLGLVGGDVDIEAGSRDPVVGPARRQRSALQEAIDRRRGATAVVGRADRRIDLAGRAMNAAAEDFRVAGRARVGVDGDAAGVRQANDRREVERRTGTERQQHGVIGCRSARRAQAGRRRRRCASGSEFRPRASSGRRDRPRSRTAARPRRSRLSSRSSGWASASNTVTRRAFHGEVERRGQTGEPGADDGDPLGLASSLCALRRSVA